MTVLCWSGGVLVGATLLHLLLWRLRLPRRQTRALLLIYFGVLALALGIRAVGPVNLAQDAQISLLVISFTLAYIITYSAVEADSPTLVMIRAIAAAGANGLAEHEFRERLSDAVLVQPRYDDLVRDGMATRDGDTYRITPKGARFVGVLTWYRRLLGGDKGG